MEERPFIIGFRAGGTPTTADHTAVGYVGLFDRHLLALADGGVSPQPSRVYADLVVRAFLPEARRTSGRAELRLLAGLREAHRSLREQPRVPGGAYVARAALLAALVTDNLATLVRVGPAAAYHVRAGRATPLLFSPLGGEPLRTEAGEALGGPNVEPPTPVVEALEILPGDTLVLTSVALMQTLSEAEVARAVTDHEPQLAAARLLNLYERRGPPTGAAVHILRRVVEEVRPRLDPLALRERANRRLWSRRSRQRAWLVGLGSLAAFALYVASVRPGWLGFGSAPPAAGGGLPTRVQPTRAVDALGTGEPGGLLPAANAGPAGSGAAAQAPVAGALAPGTAPTQGLVAGSPGAPTAAAAPADWSWAPNLPPAEELALLKRRLEDAVRGGEDLDRVAALRRRAEALASTLREIEQTQRDQRRNREERLRVLGRVFAGNPKNAARLLRRYILDGYAGERGRAVFADVEAYVAERPGVETVAVLVALLERRPPATIRNWLTPYLSRLLGGRTGAVPGGVTAPAPLAPPAAPAPAPLAPPAAPAPAPLAPPAAPVPAPPAGPAPALLTPAAAGPAAAPAGSAPPAPGAPPAAMPELSPGAALPASP